MLRSIFSLIQNIIDSDKEYSNRKSKTVIYLVSAPDNNLNMDLEIDGQQRQNISTIKEKPDKIEGIEGPKGSFKITTEQGDTVTCKHTTDKKIIPAVNHDDEKLIDEYKEAVERFSERTTFTNDEEIAGNREATGKGVSGFEDSDDQVSVHDVWDQIPARQIKTYQKEKDQITALMEQIQKMKSGMERLHEIAQQFNCSKHFKRDLEFLANNIGPTLDKSEVEDKNLTPKS